MMNYGQQKATRKSNQHMVKSYVRLRMQKQEHEIKKIYKIERALRMGFFCIILTCGVIHVAKEAIREII